MNIMPQVDFYILRQHEVSALYSFACRIIEKAYKQKYKILVLLNNKTEIESFDGLLWVFKDISFIPHEVEGKVSETTAPILLADTEQKGYDLLVNLQTQGELIEIFPRIIEIALDIEPWIGKARKKYASYREKGYALKTHKINL